MFGIFFKTLLISSLLFLYAGKIMDSEIDISAYDYPLPEKGLIKYFEYTIAIVGTNDIHGGAIPMNLTNPTTKENYLYGGLEYLSTYIQTIKKDWNDRVLWLDSGDQFQGTIENKISNGSILTDFFNLAQVDGSTIGNHEWDFGRDFLDNRLKSANWEYVVGNIYNNQTNLPEELFNTVTHKMFKVGKIKLGVIGMTTVETPITTNGNITNLIFKEYNDIIIEKAKLLRSQGAHAIVLNAHVGLLCPNEDEEKIVLRIRTEKDIQGKCQESGEMYKLLHELPTGTVDLVVSGHAHDGVHHWINKIPVIQNPSGGKFFNIMYVTFDRDFKIKIDRTRIEGPVPVCDKVLKSTHNCLPLDSHNPKGNTTIHNYKFHKTKITADPKVLDIYKEFKDELDKYKKVIAYTNVNLERDFTKENQLGNMAADIIKDVMGGDVSIINNGGFRTTWNIGPITVESVFNMFPFLDTYLVSFDMTGAELKRCLKTIQLGKKSFYATSGVVQDFVESPRSFLDVKFYNNVTIDDKATYKIVTVQFLLYGGDDFGEVLKWYTPRNVQVDRRNLRDIVQMYVEKIKEINEGDFIDPNNPRIHFKK